MLRAIAAGTLAFIMFAGTARAEPIVYTWTGFGANVAGSSRCPSYKMTINVTVDGENVKGVFQQESRPERKFETTLGKNGAIKTVAMVSGGGVMDVIGQIKEGDSKIKLDGYCIFEGKLARK
ncbi:MAG: hypothetical protein Q8K93_30240 [Reyranella sp.]|uniref:hypothetical protein n=1 Tax=Reyranella sp. TaxID=1929291 RepID=UPI00273173FE|nr:hypothetical protein [Reyranella sp.]MDP1966471.1 hypothetical protein [Reyranella sp.]MDP2374748.1 hypothetical protein [Reyranella sp.]